MSNSNTCARCGATLRNTENIAWAGVDFLCRACAGVDTRATRADLDAMRKPPLDKRQDSG